MTQMQTCNSSNLRAKLACYGTVGVCDLSWKITSAVLLEWLCTVLEGTPETAEVWEGEGFP